MFDVVELKGEHTTSAIVGRAYPPDDGLDIVRMDGLIRSNAKTSIGEYVEVTKADWKESSVGCRIHAMLPLRAFAR